MNTRATAAHAIAAASPVAHAEQARASHYEHAPGKSGSADFAQILGRQVAARGPAQGSETESKKVPNVNVTSVTTPEPSGTGLATTDKLGTSTPTAPLCHKQDAPSKEPTEDPTGGHAAALFKDPIVKVAQSATVRTLDAPDVRRSQRELAASIPAATEESKPQVGTKAPAASGQPMLQEKHSMSTPQALELEQGLAARREKSSTAENRPEIHLAAREDTRITTPEAAAHASTEKAAAKPAVEGSVAQADPSLHAPTTSPTVDPKSVIPSSAQEPPVAGRSVKESALAGVSPSTASPAAEPRSPKGAPLPIATERRGARPEVATQEPVAMTHGPFQQLPANHLDVVAKAVVTTNTTPVTTAATAPTTAVPQTHPQTPLNDGAASPKATPHPAAGRAHVLYAHARTVTLPTVAPQVEGTKARASALAENGPLTTNAPNVREPNDDANVPQPHTKAGPTVHVGHTPKPSILPSVAVPAAVATSAPIISTSTTVPSPTAPATEKPAPNARQPSKESKETKVAKTIVTPIPPATMSPPVPTSNAVPSTQDPSDIVATSVAIDDEPKAQAFSPPTAQSNPATVAHAAVVAPAPIHHSPRKPASVPADRAAPAPSAQPHPAVADVATPPPVEAAASPPKGETSPAAPATPARPPVARPKLATALADQSGIAAGNTEKPAAEPSQSPSVATLTPQPPTAGRPTSASAVSTAGPQGVPPRAKSEGIQPEKILAETKRDLNDGSNDRSNDRSDDRSDDRSGVDDKGAAPARAPHPTPEPTPTAPSSGPPHVKAKDANAAERSASEPADLSTSAANKPHSPAPTPDLLAGQNAARLVPAPTMERPAAVGTAMPPSIAVSASTIDGPAFSAAEQTSRLVDRAIDDPGLSVAVMPHAAHMSITSTTGDLALHVRVRDGSADVHVSGSMAPLFDSKAPEVRTVLAGEGLNLGSFATDQRGQSQHHHQPSEPGARSDSRPAPASFRPTSSVASDTDISDDHIHVTA